jgi:hypothetical protein
MCSINDCKDQATSEECWDKKKHANIVQVIYNNNIIKGISYGN